MTGNPCPFSCEKGAFVFAVKQKFSNCRRISVLSQFKGEKMKMNIDKLDFKKGNGLIPVVVQDKETKEVLMVAWANKEAVSLTTQTKKATFWSRSRNELWVKGQKSGNVIYVKQILVDCDNDTLIYLAKPTGPACHTGERTCFFRDLESL
jgi:phosphoribosyl-AMP cyclohydrolase